MYRVPILPLRTYQYTYIHFFPTFWIFMYVFSYQCVCVFCFGLVFLFYIQWIDFYFLFFFRFICF